MKACILSGKPVAEQIKNEVKEEIRKLDFRPVLAVIRVGDDPASAIYVKNKIKAAEEVGIVSEHYHFAEEISQEELIKEIDKLNENPEIDAILVQLPLPRHIEEKEIFRRIDYRKDVDGFHPINAGKLFQGGSSLAPCTPAGVIELLKRNGIQIKQKHAVVVGRSNIVGKPMAILLLREDATITICHSQTKNLFEITRQADILVVAVGKAGFIRSEGIKEDAVVVDVGINQIKDEKKLGEFFDGEELEKRIEIFERRGTVVVGDVNPKEAMQKASFLTPVPGGVGLLTVAMLMKNTLKAAIERRANL